MVLYIRFEILDELELGKYCEMDFDILFDTIYKVRSITSVFPKAVH